MSNKMHSFLFALGYTLSFGSTQSLRLNSSEMPHKNQSVQSLCNGFFSICNLKCHREPNCLQNCTMCLPLTSCYASLLMYSIGCESFPNHTFESIGAVQFSHRFSFAHFQIQFSCAKCFPKIYVIKVTFGSFECIENRKFHIHFFSLPFHYNIAYGDEKKFLINFAQISNNQWF